MACCPEGVKSSPKRATSRSVAHSPAWAAGAPQGEIASSPSHSAPILRQISLPNASWSGSPLTLSTSQPRMKVLSEVYSKRCPGGSLRCRLAT